MLEAVAAAASSTQAGANDQVSVSGSSLLPGRWYVTPENVGTGAADFDLTVELEFGGSRAQPGYGNWFNPQRSGSGFFFSPFADGAVWTLSWYTYLQDGTPAWLGGTLPAPGPNQGSASFDLYRFSWDGTRTHSVVVGTATLSHSFAWESSSSGRMPTAIPPASQAPRDAAAMTPPRPPQITTIPAPASACATA